MRTACASSRSGSRARTASAARLAPRASPAATGRVPRRRARPRSGPPGARARRRSSRGRGPRPGRRDTARPRAPRRALRRQAVFEGDGIDLEPGLGPDRDAIRSGCPARRRDRRRHRRARGAPATAPGGATRRCAVGVRPQVRGDRLPRSRTPRQHQQREQRRCVAAPESHRRAIDRPDVEAPEQVDAEDRALDRFVSRHDIPRS